MINSKKIFAVAFIATFIAAIPLALSVSFSELDSVTYTLELQDYYAKPPGTPGGGRA